MRTMPCCTIAPPGGARATGGAARSGSGSPGSSSRASGSGPPAGTCVPATRASGPNAMTPAAATAATTTARTITRRSVTTLEDLDARDPLDPREPAVHRRDQPQRGAVLGAERYVSDMCGKEQRVDLIRREGRGVSGDRRHPRAAARRYERSRGHAGPALRASPSSRAVERRVPLRAAERGELAQREETPPAVDDLDPPPRRVDRRDCVEGPGRHREGPCRHDPRPRREPGCIDAIEERREHDAAGDRAEAAEQVA